ncbi:MAG: hypothetical protein ABJB66_14250 [Gemmatimonadaceae bacterium]
MSLVPNSNFLKHRYTVLLVAALAVATQRVGAQESRSVDGRVVRPVSVPITDTGKAPKKIDSLALTSVTNAMVTLHRVAKDGQGPLDSVRTDAKGVYHFSFRTKGDADAVYFTSVTWGGIAYFTAPLRNVVTRDRDAEITVFDTTTRALPLTISGRHLIVSAADTSNQRTVVEVFEISNDSALTMVSADSKTGKPTWSVAVPVDARNVKVGQGEVTADALTATPGRVSVFSAIAPGVKQISFSYRVPSQSFPLSFVVEHGASVLEVLLEDPTGRVTGSGLAATDPVSLENRNFRRFLAQDVKDGAIISVILSSGPSVGRNLYIAMLLGTIGVVMLLILFRAVQRRRPALSGGTLTPTRAPEAPLADRIAREIVDLDATFAKHENPSDALHQAYKERRAELKDALAAEIARR